jgi:hypothetical protein
MRNLIGAKIAGDILLVLFGLLVVFHIVILLNLLPTNMVWGGRAGSTSNPRALLIVSLVFNLIFAIAVAVKVGYIPIDLSSRVVNIILWVIFAYLLLNTVGNLASSSAIEKFVFTPLTIVAAILVLRLAMER